MHQYGITRKKLLQENCYVLSLDYSINNTASALSNHTIELIDLERLEKLNIFKSKIGDSITGLKFSPCDSNILYSSSKDGFINVWDIRIGDKPTQQFTDASEDKTKPLTCFDFNSNNILMAGTEQMILDAYLLFWDLRSTNLLGGYWESHTDDITAVKFHPEDSYKVASTGEDGLINLFDVKQTDEDGALEQTLNAECSVYSLTWLKDGKKLACLTNNEETQIWDWEEVCVLYSHQRDKLDTFKTDYFVDVIENEAKEFLLIGGTNDGSCHLWKLNEDLIPYARLEGGHKDRVRCVRKVDSERFLTGGEDGAVCLWKEELKDAAPLKEMKKRDHKKKPY